mmetsp:Transcript_99451/g.257050  ORF Transcript_99451/g.257050 Transcript_99451/m.257050 type:complete len:440 (-) Transcript_99451:129-1448(-)
MAPHGECDDQPEERPRAGNVARGVRVEAVRAAGDSLPVDPEVDLRTQELHELVPIPLGPALRLVLDVLGRSHVEHLLARRVEAVCQDTREHQRERGHGHGMLRTQREHGDRQADRKDHQRVAHTEELHDGARADQRERGTAQVDPQVQAPEVGDLLLPRGERVHGQHAVLVVQDRSRHQGRVRHEEDAKHVGPGHEEPQAMHALAQLPHQEALLRPRLRLRGSRHLPLSRLLLGHCGGCTSLRVGHPLVRQQRPVLTVGVVSEHARALGQDGDEDEADHLQDEEAHLPAQAAHVDGHQRAQDAPDLDCEEDGGEGLRGQVRGGDVSHHGPDHGHHNDATGLNRIVHRPGLEHRRTPVGPESGSDQRERHGVQHADARDEVPRAPHAGNGDAVEEGDREEHGHHAGFGDGLLRCADQVQKDRGLHIAHKSVGREGHQQRA